MFFILKYATKFLCIDTLFLVNRALCLPTKIVNTDYTISCRLILSDYTISWRLIMSIP